jgi:hypothetical protein
MNNTHTAALLDLLEKPELAALGRFLKPAAKEIPHRLFLQLREPAQRAVQSPKDVFAKVFSGKAFNRKTWNKALSEMNGCIRDFLAVQQLLSDAQLRMKADVSAFFGRTNTQAFKRAVKVALRKLSGTSVRETAESWQLRFWTLKHFASYPLTDHIKGADKLLDGLDESIDFYYFISKLQLACNRASSAQVLPLQNDPAVVGQLLAHTEHLDQSGKSALLTLYRALLHLLAAPEAQFEPFFALLQQHGPRLGRSELEPIVRFALNNCIQRYRAVEAEAFEQYRRVFGWADKQNPWTILSKAEDFFLNDGIMFAKSQDAAGFKDFLDKGKKALPGKRRSKAVALLEAYGHFYQGEFREATILLNRLDSRHPRLSLRFHSLKVRNTYEEWRREQVELDELERALRSFKDFLQRNGSLFAKPLRQSYRSLIWFIQKMMRHGEKRALSKKRLQTELGKRQPAASDWIAVKINELP